MKLSPEEAEESLKLIQKTAAKARHSIAKSGIIIFLVITGFVWLIGFLGTQFLPGKISVYVWIAVGVLGSLISIILGRKAAPKVQNPSSTLSAKRAIFFWICLVLFCAAVLAIAHPADGKQITMIIFMFIMIGQLSMGFLISFSSTWWTLPIAALVLIGYFLFPGIYYLWMGVLVGGSMIVLGFYIRRRW